MKELDTLRTVFLGDDIDDETRLENEQKIAEWQRSLSTHKAMAGWQAHDISQQIVRRLKDSYRDFAVTLATNRSLTDEQRKTLWAKQDAVLWLLAVIAPDASAELSTVENEIRLALANATNR